MLKNNFEKNVFLGTGIVYHLSKNELSTMDQQMEENIHENNGTFLKKKYYQICSNQIDF